MGIYALEMATRGYYPVHRGQVGLTLPMTDEDVNGYIKYVSQEAIDSLGTLVDLDGRAITRAGWYDFTQRQEGGDGARFIDETGDGTVAVSETRIPGLSRHVTVAASHSGLVFSPDAARQTAALGLARARLQQALGLLP